MKFISQMYDINFIKLQEKQKKESGLYEVLILFFIANRGE